MCSLQSLATSTQRKIRVAPFHMAHYSAFCINPKPQGMKRWSKVTRGYKVSGFILKRSMDSAPTLQRRRGLKMLIQWRGRSQGKSLILTGSNATAGPIPVYGREGDRTRKGLYSDECLWRR